MLVDQLRFELLLKQMELRERLDQKVVAYTLLMELIDIYWVRVVLQLHVLVQQQEHVHLEEYYCKSEM